MPDFSQITLTPDMTKEEMMVAINENLARLRQERAKDGSITDQKLDYPRFWQEIARTTLTVAGDVIDVTGIPARRHLLIILVGEADGGTLDTGFTFNGDTGTNYAVRYSVQQGATTAGVSLPNIPIESSATASGGVTHNIVDMYNPDNGNKMGSYANSHDVTTTAATTTPNTLDGSFKWVNTAQVNRITWTNTGTGNFAIGSEVVVLGHN